jgi:transcriptional regulator of acetoin/glycerol metabolism
MSNFAVDHVNRVRSVVQRQSGLGRNGTANRVTQSWIRCLDEYRLDPGSCAEPEVVSAAELKERQERLADVQAVAKVEMSNLYQQLAGSGYAIMLTDREGVLLNYFGDPAFTHAASRTGLMPGAVWSERAQGTNGMGTCLFERRPVTVHQDEHYLSRNTGLSCAAAPNQRTAFVAAQDAGREGPGHLQIPGVLAVDLFEFAVALVVDAAGLHRPVFGVLAQLRQIGVGRKCRQGSECQARPPADESRLE